MGSDIDATIPPAIGDAEFEFNSADVALLEDAVSAVRHLNTLPLANLGALAVPLLRAESVASSRIENLRVSHRGVAEALDDPRHASRAAREVANNVRAMRDAIELANSEVLDRRALRRIHATLLAGTPDERHGGVERDVQNWIGGANIRDAVYVPPPPANVGDLLDDLVVFTMRRDLPAIAQAAIAHAQFEGIHPFVDGNGRVGRCLVHALLHRRNVADRLVPPISTVLLATRDAYYADLAAWQRDGRPEPIVRAFAAAALTASTHAAQMAIRFAQLQEEWIERVSPLRRDAVARRVIAELPAHPLLTPVTIGSVVAADRRVALRAIDQLTNAGVLRLVDETRRRGRVWFADEVFDLLDEFETAVARDAGRRKVAPTRHLRR